MSISFDLTMTAFSAGMGLGLLGGANAFWRRSSLALRGPISFAIAGVMTGITYLATHGSEPAMRVAAILAAAYTASLLAGSNRWASTLAQLATALRRPIVHWGALGLLGLGGALGAVAYSEAEEELLLNREMAELEALTTKPACETPAVRVITDTGREVAVQEAISPRELAELAILDEAILGKPFLRDHVIRCQPASDQTNCHGWVFTGGRFWVASAEVDRILIDNGYRTTDEPRPGDLVIYRGGEDVTHTAVVRYTTPNQPVLVEGKWGCSGVYLHPVDKSIYGENFKYYRSPRYGHLLAGLNSVAPQPSPSSPLIAHATSNPDEFTE